MATLRGRIFVPTALIASVVGLTLAVLAVQSHRHFNVVAREVDEIRAANALSLSLADATEDEQRWVLSFQVRAAPWIGARIARAEGQVTRLIDQVGTLELQPRAAELWQGYVATRALLLVARDELMRAARSRDAAALSIAFEKWELASDRADALMTSFSTYHVRRLERAVADLQRGRVRALWTAVGAVLLGAALAVAFSVYLVRTLVRPISGMSATAERIAQGGAAAPVEGSDREDEIGTLARAFNRMTDRLLGANERLEEAVRARDEFISIASHELKTPLTPLKLRLQALLREARGARGELSSARLVEVARGFEKLVSRIAILVENMLDVSRVASGKLVLSIAPVDVAELLRETVEHLREQLEQAGCTVRLECGYAGAIEIDRLRLEQVLDNLLSNAAKYAAGTAIAVRCARDGRDLLLEVEDRGVGIAEADQERIFGRFERAVGKASGTAGLGLGLYIAREIVRAHGGELSVSSRPGEGTTFAIRLPLERRPTIQTPPPGTGKAPRRDPARAPGAPAREP
jgi:signal transduction histidine kinase